MQYTYKNYNFIINDEKVTPEDLQRLAKLLDEKNFEKESKLLVWWEGKNLCFVKESNVLFEENLN